MPGVMLFHPSIPISSVCISVSIVLQTGILPQQFPSTLLQTSYPHISWPISVTIRQLHCKTYLHWTLSRKFLCLPISLYRRITGTNWTKWILDFQGSRQAEEVQALSDYMLGVYEYGPDNIDSDEEPPNEASDGSDSEIENSSKIDESRGRHRHNHAFTLLTSNRQRRRCIQSEWTQSQTSSHYRFQVAQMVSLEQRNGKALTSCVLSSGLISIPRSVLLIYSCIFLARYFLHDSWTSFYGCSKYPGLMILLQLKR